MTPRKSPVLWVLKNFLKEVLGRLRGWVRGMGGYVVKGGIWVVWCLVLCIFSFLLFIFCHRGCLCILIYHMLFAGQVKVFHRWGYSVFLVFLFVYMFFVFRCCFAQWNHWWFSIPLRLVVLRNIIDLHTMWQWNRCNGSNFRGESATRWCVGRLMESSPPRHATSLCYGGVVCDYLRREISKLKAAAHGASKNVRWSWRRDKVMGLGHLVRMTCCEKGMGMEDDMRMSRHIGVCHLTLRSTGADTTVLRAPRHVLITSIKTLTPYCAMACSCNMWHPPSLYCPL